MAGLARDDLAAAVLGHDHRVACQDRARAPEFVRLRPVLTERDHEIRGALHRFLHPIGDRAQCAVVVEDVESAAEGGADEIVLALLNGEVAERDIRRTTLELGPGAAAVHGEKHAEFRAEEYQAGIFVILHDAPQQVPVRQVASAA